MKHRVASNVKCPFYKCEERQLIYCEGVQQDTATHVAFAYPSQLAEYRDKYCRDCWKECSLSKALQTKYQD